MNVRLVAIITISVLLSACGGSANNDETLGFVVPELRITSIDIDDFDFDFDPESVGVYEIETSSETESVDISFSISDDALKGEVFYSVNNVVLGQIEGSDNLFTLELDLDEGTNLLRIILVEDSEITSLNYSFEIYRIFSTASLTGLALFEFPDGTAITSDLSPSFDSEEFSYTLEVPYTGCSIAAVPFSNSAATSIVVDGEEFDAAETINRNLEVGRNFFDISVMSEDGESEFRYAIEVTRADAEDSDLLSNANLRNLDVQGLDFDYFCGVTDYSLTVNSDVGSIVLDLETEVDGAQVWIDDELIDPEEGVFIEIEDDLQVVTARVVSADDSEEVEYSLNILRRSNNLVEVETVEELIDAFKNAAPNDQIEIAEGEYDFSSVDPSLLSAGTLTTDRSGSALQPIIVTIESADETTLLGSGVDGAPILSFSGRHWQVSGITFSNADVGVEFNGSENILLSSTNFEDITTTAIVEVAGVDNMVRTSRFESIGDAASPATIIAVSGASSSFDIRQNTFVLNAGNTAISVEAATQDTFIESNIFSHEEALTELEQTVISVAGANARVNYNLFDFNLRAFNQAIVDIFATASDANEGIFVFENRFDGGSTTEDITIPFVAALDSPVFVQLPEHTPETVSVSGTDVQDWTPPNYKIVYSDDPDYCVSIYQDEDLDFGTDGDENLVGLDLCDGSDEQAWQIEVGEEAPYIKFKNVSIDDELAYMSTVSTFASFCGLSESFPSVFLDEDTGGFGQGWFLARTNYQLTIRTKLLTSFTLTLDSGQADVDEGLSMCPALSVSSQIFELIAL